MVELSDLITELRKALTAAQEEGKDKGIQFEVGPVDLELEIATEYNGKAGVKIYVVDLGGDTNRKRTQKINLTLQPKSTSTGRSPQVSGSHAKDDF